MKVTAVEATTHRVPARVPLLREPLMAGARDGHAPGPAGADRPGLGLEPNEEALRDTLER